VYAVVVRESGDAEQIERSADLVNANVAPRVRQAPGFVSALWMSDGSGRTLNVLAFESEEAARAVLEAARTSPRPRFMKVERAELFRVLATA
jgi:muconolactone delta-isomerase